MMERFVCNVPQRIWQEGRPAGSRSWRSVFNVAGWLKLDSESQGRVALLVVREDGKDVHRTTIDSCRANGKGTLLLSSEVELPLSDKITSLRLIVQFEDDAARYHFDELYMQLKRGQVKQSKLIAV